MSEDVLLPTSLAARALGVSASSLCKWALMGAPVAQVSPGGHRRWSVPDLEAWLEETCDDAADDEEGEDADDGEEAETCSHCGAELEPDDEDDAEDDDSEDSEDGDD